MSHSREDLREIWHRLADLVIHGFPFHPTTESLDSGSARPSASSPSSGTVSRAPCTCCSSGNTQPLLRDNDMLPELLPKDYDGVYLKVAPYRYRCHKITPGMYGNRCRDCGKRKAIIPGVSR